MAWPTRSATPLPDTHPELVVVRWPAFVEYRVEHWRLARDGSGRIVRGTRLWSWLDLVVLALLSVQRPRLSWSLAALALALGYLVWTRCTQVLHESVLVFPTLGIQFETHRGHPGWGSPLTLTVTRRFIPLDALEDVVLHEAFARWDVRFYLAAVYRARSRTCAWVRAGTGQALVDSDTDTDGVPVTRAGVVAVHVAFENVRPYFPILHVVYLGVHEMLFSSADNGADADAGRGP